MPPPVKLVPLERKVPVAPTATVPLPRIVRAPVPRPPTLRKPVLLTAMFQKPPLWTRTEPALLVLGPMEPLTWSVRVP